MRERIVAAIGLMGFGLGCGGRADKEPLTQFLHVIEIPLKTSYEDDVRRFPAAEWGVRRTALRNRHHVVLIDEFFGQNPPLTARARELVDAVRRTFAAQAELFEKIAEEKRPRRSVEEEQEVQRLQADVQRYLTMIGRRIDGKE